MITKGSDPLTDEKPVNGTGTRRLLHLLKHPEEHDRDGEHLDTAGTLASAMAKRLHVVPKVGDEPLQASTKKPDAPESLTQQWTKTREIAPWVTTARQKHPT
jgi:hypothetical protein